jgi:ATP-binding cassette, subfamily B, bacterial
VTAEREASHEHESPQPFDPLAYIQSSGRQRRDVRSLPALATDAVRLAREASPRLFWLNTVLQLFTAGVMALQVLLGELALEALIEQADATDGSLGKALPPLIALVAVTAISGLVTSSQQQLQRLLGEAVQRLTWTRIIEVTTKVPLETFEGPQFFDELQRVKANALIRPLTLSQGLTQLVGGLVGVAGLSVALILIEPILLPILLVGGAPLWLLSRRMGKLEFDFRVGQTPQLRLREYLTNLLSGRDEAKEIRAFGLGGVIYRRWLANYDEFLRDYRSHITRRVWLSGLSALVTTVVTSASLGVLIMLVLDDRIALASAGAALIAIRLLGARIQQVFVGIGELFESSLFLRDFDAFLGRAPDHRPPGEADAPAVAPFEQLVLDDVSFRYPGARRDAVRGVSLRLQAGEVIALVGENGSGKTTLAKLLAHVFEPTSGRILWGDVDSRKLDGDGVRRNVGVIFQDFVRYQLTARENIGFGRAERLDDLEGIIAAAEQSGAEDFLRHLPRGFETSLGKEYVGGFDLSLGQWQRLALARVFFRDAAFLVLDEPTASLDARSEHELFQHVQRLAAGRSLLLISHRFSTVKNADRIYVMHDGELIEEGSHDELIARGGRYAELFDLQARAYR